MVKVGEKVRCIHNHWVHNGLDSTGPDFGDELNVHVIHWANGVPWYEFKEWPKAVFLHESFEPVVLDLDFAQSVVDYITLTAAENE